MNESISQLEALYREYGSGLLQYLRRSFKGIETAEDLLQETFVQALRGRQRFKAVASPRAWLFTIARRVGLTAMRRRHRTTTLPADVPEPAGTEPDARLERVRRAISALPPRQREVVELRLREDLSYEEIAAVLEIPVGTVRSGLHEARRRLCEAVPGADG
jgi:RNA polymerase sigma-70 factor, ECF subfamily